ncbi:MAG: BlaI/MecI/CopY family transcriptional regulator [Candidatus Eisenbacteria bacterium]|uniref:BlaI/MecI/CopY family transcriptional regulator n=1 Tax=Eiseniibacteriota bacterium TaxID=2212470 RepID=A0A948WC09_UNCEI|nr:BlaI/MecI/CopY family transcriptional regulator [Candidatus Eisenbacteria bacterium]MBU1949164.1 BlaI/MecI/CopY family transcriptional regulator [Candidatus Eisenbacteria bacterium]MBU2690488.1 BlaI/MecI/CopY family transcriptional regulator [Candidatus Eisenbacteria bacterium]
MKALPDLSRFELQCLRKLWSCKEGTVRDIYKALEDPPSYSTVRKIVERLEEKGAVERVRMEGKAWLYRSTVSAPAMIRKEIRRFLDVAFDGAALPLMSHLADMKEVSLKDLREIEKRVASHRSGQRSSEGGQPGSGK